MPYKGRDKTVDNGGTDEGLCASMSSKSSKS